MATRGTRARAPHPKRARRGGLALLHQSDVAQIRRHRAPFAGRKVTGRCVPESQTLALAEATGLDPLEALDRLLHRVAARLRRDGAPFLEPGAAVVCVEHGGLEADRASSDAAEVELAQAWRGGTG